MGILYLLNRTAALPACLAVAGPNDTILLIEEAVYAAVRPIDGTSPVAALLPDVVARGLAPRLRPECACVTDREFVELVARHRLVVTWTD